VTVKEAIEQLSKYPPDAEVVTHPQKMWTAPDEMLFGWARTTKTFQENGLVISYADGFLLNEGEKVVVVIS